MTPAVLRGWPVRLALSALALVLTALTAAPAHAQAGRASYSEWSVSGDTVMLRYRVPAEVARRVAGSPVQVLVSQRFGEYLLAHTAVSAAEGPCPAIDQGFDIGKVDPLTVQSGLYGFEIFFRCPSEHPHSLALRDSALFDRSAGRMTFASIQVQGAPAAGQLFTASRQVLHLPDRGAPATAGLGRYFSLGAHHIVGSLVRLCLLAALLLLIQRMRDVPPVAAALAAGYALALLGALGANLTAKGDLIEAGLGLLIALLAAARIARTTGFGPAVAGTTAALLAAIAVTAALLQAPSSALLAGGGAVFATGALVWAARAGSALPAAALLGALFGVLDGFALPSLLPPLHLSAAQRAPMLIGFDLGAIVVEVALLAAVLFARTLVRAVRGSGSLARRALLADMATAALAGFGVLFLLGGLAI
jgi:hypothetical protein